MPKIFSMNFEVRSIAVFERQVRRLIKKYPSIKNDLSGLIGKLKVQHTQGTSLGNNCYKIRLAIRSKGKGKSGGGWVITCVKVARTTVFLLTIFDKSDQASISDKELKELLKHIPG